MQNITPVLTDAATLRLKLHAKTVGALTAAFPLDLKGRTLELQDVRVHAQDFSPTDEYDALMKGSSLNEPVKGTLVLRGADGKVIDTAKNFTLTHLPFLTSRHTLISGGNEYQVANQLRRKPGVYTQRSENGELKTVFNLGRGKNFDVTFNENKGTYHLQYGTSNLPLYAVLRGLGVSHEHIAGKLGEGVAQANEKEHGHQVANTMAKLYLKLEHPALVKPGATHDEKVTAIKKRYDLASLDPDVTHATLGHAYDKVTPDVMLGAAKKILQVHKGEKVVDDTDSLTFKTFHSMDDFIAERIRLTARVWAPKAKMALTGKSVIRDALKPAPFSDSIKKFLTVSSLSAVPTGINPMEILDHSVKVTSLGEGGIPSDRAIPLEARMIHNTQFGALDPIRTPECHRGDGEVFTKGGWKRWDAVTERDLFACRIGGALQFHRPERLVKTPYAGLLYGVNTGKLQYLVTPEHKVLCAPVDRVYPARGEVLDQFDLVRADEVHGKVRAFDTGHAPHVGSRVETYQLPAVAGYKRSVPPMCMTSWAAFMGWYLAEGCVSLQANGEPARVNISQSRKANAWKCEILDALLARLPFKWAYRGSAFHINSRPLAAYLHSFGFCDTKYIPEYFFETPLACRQALLEALLLGDGRINSNRRTGKTYKQEVFCTTSYALARDVERLIISLGRSPRMRTYRDEREARYLDVHEVRILRDRIRQAVPRKGHYYTQHHDGDVFCATVPGGLLLVRQGDGIGHWSGNSSHSGVDIRATIAAHRDDKGNLYTVMKNLKTGKDEFVRSGDLSQMTVAFPHQGTTGKIDVFHHGEQAKMDASRATHQLNHVSHIYSPATTLIPFIHSIQGNRAIMGSKMGTQALPLLEREAPLVQVRSHLPEGHSFEQVYGHMIVPRASVSGTVAKIDKNYVWIRPHGEKKAASEVAQPIGLDGVKTHLDKSLAGHAFKIDRPAGFKKTFVNPDGSHSHLHYTSDYGYIPGHVGEDGEDLDVFVGDDPNGFHGSFHKGKTEWEDGKRTGRILPDETKFYAGLSKQQRDHLLGPEMLGPVSSDHKTYESLDHLMRAVSPYRVKTAADKDEKGLIKVPYHQFFPFPSKTYLHHDIQVKVGDTVKEGQRLGESNYTKNGTLALGKNLLVGYMPYYGFNSNDAVVISDACSKKLTSEHMYREVYPLSSQIELNKEKHRMYYGTKYLPESYGKLDADGVVKKGAKVNAKDPLVLGLSKQTVMGTDAMLGRISKALSKPYREVTLSWTHGAPGEVIDVVRTNTQITILVRTQERMQVGDKLAGRYGNKGVVSKIVPDHEMLQDAQGRPIDLLLTSAGVVSRINPAQVIETAVSKVAEKTGKPIVYDNAAGHNAVKWARELMQTHGVTDKEHLFDPVLNRKILGGDGKGVLVGRQFIYKLFKSTDTNFAGHGVGPYDLNEQPLKTGGDDSAKGLGKMEFDALLAHNARNFLREAATVKGQKNDEFWKAVQTGMPLPQPKPSFAFNKFTAMLEGSGIKVDKRGSKMTLMPLTDHDVMKRSAGAIANNKTIQSKNLNPEKGGLFDPLKTGGNQGTLYSHIDLHEPIPNPVFKDPVRRLLGLSEKDYDKAIHDQGGSWFKGELQKINVPQKIQELRGEMRTVKGPVLNDVIKQIKSLEALQKNNMTPHDAYVISKVPVIPPVFRPILPGVRDPSQLMVADANKLYAQLMDSSDTLKRTAMESDRGKHRLDVYNKVEELYGVTLPQDAKMQQQKVKGFLATLAGVGTPKGGFFQRKLMRHTQDVSGRGTAVPDANLGMDEVGMPEQMLWQMLDKLIVARLIRRGYPALQAREMVTKRDPTAHDAMLEETRERPMWINRAPTLHRWGIIAAYAKPVQGKTLRVSPFIETGMNLDYDGDTLQVHVPVTPDAVTDAKSMTMTNLLMSDQQRNRIMAFPQHEAIIGFTHAAKSVDAKGAVRTFKNREDALAAWRGGELKMSDAINVLNTKHAADTEADNYGLGEALPAAFSTVSPEAALSYFPPENVTGVDDEDPEEADVPLSR